MSAHVANNTLAGADVGGLIQSVFETMNRLASGEPEAPVELVPAVPIKRSVTDDYIVCLEDGKKLKMLKRHLMTAYDMTPEEYRAKWGLKPDYPMVAPDYAAKRQELAKKIGLGRKPAGCSSGTPGQAEAVAQDRRLTSPSLRARGPAVAPTARTPPAGSARPSACPTAASCR